MPSLLSAVVSARVVRARLAGPRRRRPACRRSRPRRRAGAPAGPHAPVADPGLKGPDEAVARSLRGAVRRLLPVRLRRLDEGDAHPGRRGELGPELQRHPRRQPEGASRDPRARRRRATREATRTASSSATSGRRAWTRTAIEKRALEELKPELKRIDAVRDPQDAGRRDRAPSLDRRRRRVRLRQRDRLQGRVDDDRGRLSGGPRPARARLLLPRRRAHEGHPRGLREPRRSARSSSSARRRSRPPRTPRPS